MNYFNKKTAIESLSGNFRKVEDSKKEYNAAQKVQR